jgi:amino acid transporter
MANLRRLLLGRRLPRSAEQSERLSRPRAIGAFGLDALSSVGYGPDEIFYVLLLAGAAGMALALPVACAIVLLMALVVASYRQTIYAYPNGGGSYTVARENLGERIGLLAAAALMVNYLTTVAVSVAAGIEALLVLLPALVPLRLWLDAVAVGVLMLINLRGLKEAGAAFVVPTYVFLGSLALLLGWAGWRALFGHLPHAAAVLPAPSEGLSLFLVLRAFTSGCVSFTGVEALANGVPAFRRPIRRNAAATLVTLAVLLAPLLLGITLLGQHIGAVPGQGGNIIAQIGVAAVGRSPLFWLVQLSSAIILILAANTAFNGFPLLAATMARDGYLPRQFAHRGQRLAYSNGILLIGGTAVLLLLAFGGSTHALIPLFAVGVFLCFTLSQAGMVRHWWRHRTRQWRAKLVLNGTGGVVTGLVTLIMLAVKFTAGAWLIVLIIPVLVWLYLKVQAYYRAARRALRTLPPHPAALGRRPHTVIVPIAELDRAALAALAYAAAIGDRVVAVHVSQSATERTRLRDEWADLRGVVPLDVRLVRLDSPYRRVVRPLVAYVEERAAAEPGLPVTVVLPELVPQRGWERLLHNQVALRLKLELLGCPGVVVTSVPYHLPI